MPAKAGAPLRVRLATVTRSDGEYWKILEKLGQDGAGYSDLAMHAGGLGPGHVHPATAEDSR